MVGRCRNDRSSQRFFRICICIAAGGSNFLLHLVPLTTSSFLISRLSCWHCPKWIHLGFFVIVYVVTCVILRSTMTRASTFKLRPTTCAASASSSHQRWVHGRVLPSIFGSNYLPIGSVHPLPHLIPSPSNIYCHLLPHISTLNGIYHHFISIFEHPK